jgi:hypothetical protein
MTLEPRLLAVHERLERMASSMTAPDIEAGWSAVAAALAPPLAQVVPLPRRSRGRVVLLVAAAALLVTGGAFAAVMAHGETPRHVAPPVSTVEVGVPAAGPHLHPVFGGPGASTGPTTGTPGRDGAAEAGSQGSANGPGSSSAPAQGQHEGGAPDDPNDRDQGQGNDGAHNDRGGGNDGREGTAPPGQAKH